MYYWSGAEFLVDDSFCSVERLLKTEVVVVVCADQWL